MSRGTTFRLNEPGMGEYERAGLAGLYLSLTAAAAWESQRQKYPLPKNVEERLDALRETIANLGASGFPLVEDGLGLCLEWPEGGEIAALEAIVKWAWQVHDGVLFLPGVHRKREHLDGVHLRAHVHSGMMGTFFQHNNVIKKEKPQKKVVPFDEDKTLSVSWRPVLDDDHRPPLPQHRWEIPKKGVCGDAMVRNVAAWIHPGSALRFKGAERNWSGPARFAYLMLFVPIACHYIRLPSKDMAYLVPGVENLREYQREFLKHMATSANWPFQGHVAGLEDAALHYAARGRARRQSVWSTAVVMGLAGFFHPYNKTRKNVLRDIAAGDDADMKKAFRRYRIFNRVFPPGSMLRKSKDDMNDEEKASHYVALPNCRERITANILRGDPWYADLTRIPFWQRDKIDNDREWFLKLHKYERKHLMTIAEDKEMWDDPAEKEMLDAFHEALERLLNREDAALDRGGDRDLHKRWAVMHDKWHRRFSEAKTKHLLSRTVHEFFSEAARSPIRRNGEVVKDQRRPIHRLSPSELRRMVNHPRDWKKVCDLALLALTKFRHWRLARREDGESS